MKRRLLCFGAVLSLMWSCGTSACASFADIVDVKIGTYYYEAVEWAMEGGITTGTDQTHFSPDDSCKKKYALTFLWRLKVKNVDHKTYEKSDLEEAVDWAIRKGLETEGFDPEETCSRAVFLGYLYRVQMLYAPVRDRPSVTSGQLKELLEKFPDMRDQEDYAQKAVAWATGLEITNGKTNKDGSSFFDPEGKCTRANIMTFLHRYALYVDSTTGA